jgi:predicted regulator of Ras-like GTPase activity (Roadblock/LC7/MglB family)
MASEPPAPVQTALSDLAREIQADAVLLLSARQGQEAIVAQVSTLGQEEVQILAGQSLTTIREAQVVAQLLGQANHPFEHNMFESETVRYYVMTLPEDMLLVTVTPISTPLGTIRHNLRRAARTLTR